jgi:hypothetical protein
MPIEINYLDGERGVLFIGAGKVTGEEIITSNRQVFSSEEKMKKVKYGLIDYSKITQFEVSTVEVESIISQEKKASEYIADGVLAIVAKKNVAFGINRMWESIAEYRGLQWETMVFRHREDAEVWIRQKVNQKFGIGDLTLG